MAIPDQLLERARAWLREDVDPATRDELSALIERATAGDDGGALAERFADRLQFGTAGIRGILGAGPMGMNRVMVRRVSAGLADYLLDTVDGARERGVVVGYDGRVNSRVFAEDASRVFAGKGLRVHLTPDVVPTPMAAFAVLDRHAAAGVMVTASHNPPAYNGYKVYWGNGAQIIPPHDRGIADAIDRVGRTDELPLPDLDDARASELLVDVGPDVERRYLDGVRALARHPDAASRAPLRIAYTPLHGVGAHLVEAALAEAGFEHVATEPSQREPDGAFPTVEFPNPEEDGAMDRVLALAAANDAELVLANDPDADRLAVAVPAPDGGYRMLTGDQIGLLLADYLLEAPAEGSRLVAATIVSSQLLELMAAARGVDFVATLTGFKWIANAAIEHARKHGSTFVAGYEEALGYSVGELVRDKDGVSAAAVFAEMAAHARAQGETVLGRLEAIYRRFGFFATEQVSLVLPGSDGLARIAELMQKFRDEPPAQIGGYPVVAHHDVAAGALGLPPSDVLIFKLQGERRVIMRPSGTEPKLKSYYEVREPVAADEPFADAVTRADSALSSLRDAHQAMLS